MNLSDVKILWNRSLGADYRRMGLATGAGYEQSVPGQFVMVKADRGLAPLLRRPFSIHRLLESDSGGEGIELLYKIVGPSTARMSALRADETLSLLGPLGRGYTCPPDPGPVALAGGGIGIAPLVFLASHLLENGVPPDLIRIFLGGRSAVDLLCADDFAGMGLAVALTTDDGSQGEKGVVTRPLERALKDGEVKRIYACGPMGMLRGIAGLAAQYKAACEVSIETVMACGMGACMGCAVKSRLDAGEKRQHACLDGPVFDAAQITFET